MEDTKVLKMIESTI